MRVVIWCGMIRWWTPLHDCIILCPGHGSDGGCGGRDCHGEKKRQVQRSLKHARLCFSSYGDLTHVGPINVTGQNFLRDLGRKLTTSKGDNRETCFLLQRLSVTIQRFNSVAFRGTLPEPDLRE